MVFVFLFLTYLTLYSKTWEHLLMRFPCGTQQRGESFLDVTFGTPVILGQFPTLRPHPGKAWASTVVAACCGDGGPSHPTPRGGSFSPRGWSKKSALHCRFPETMFWKVEWLKRADSAPCCRTLTLSGSRTIKKYFWPAVSTCYQQESFLPVTHQNFGNSPYQIFAPFFLRVISPCRKKPQTIRK